MLSISTHSVRRLSACFLLSALSTACSVGGNDPKPETDTPESQKAETWVVLGPLSETTLTVKTLEGTERAKGTTAKYSADVDTRTVDGAQQLKKPDEGRKVGIVTYSRLDLDSLAADTLLLLSATGGRDVDANDDGTVASTEGLSGPEIKGTVAAFAPAGRVRSGRVVLNLLTTLASGANTTGVEATELAKRLDQFAQLLLKAAPDGDIDGDGKISHADLLAFDPSLQEVVDGKLSRTHDRYLRSPAQYALWLQAALGDGSASPIRRIQLGGDTNSATRITAQLFGDSDGDGLANVFEDASKNDTDGDGSMDNVDTDLDGDGLSNDEEATRGLNPYSRDTDLDGLADGSEVNVSKTDPLKADTDGDGLADGLEVNTYRTSPKNTDTDGDGIADGIEVNGFKLFDGQTVVRTDPLSIDSDGDKLHDGLEKAVQDAFAKYVVSNGAGPWLRGALHPSNRTTPAALGGLDYSAVTNTAAILEQDPDGDGKPTIEELFFGKDPNSAASTFQYVYEAADSSALPRHQALLAAGFVYVPGNWDVDGDGTVDTGFYVSRFEARSAASGTVAIKHLPELMLAAQVYNPTLLRFSDRLCSRLNGGDGTDASTTDTDGSCRGNQYLDLEIGAGLPPASFDPALPAKTGISWAEARAVLLGSPVDSAAATGGPYPIDLPSEVQWLQLVSIAINTPSNWTGNAVNSGRLYQGHSDNEPFGVLAITHLDDGYSDTGNAANSGPTQRRTLGIPNGIVARDFGVPLSYQTTVWDLAGNAAEWTRGLIAAKSTTSLSKSRAGGDRFVNGLTAPLDYLGIPVSGTSTVSLSLMPGWWKPTVGGKVLGTASGAGLYLDGAANSDGNGDGQSDGARSQLDYGYGADGFSDGFSAILRGGDYASIDIAGVAAAEFLNAPGFRAPSIGFRAVALPVTPSP
ncbi:MAG: hypothetical protein Q8R02_20585 [Hyphomonadaceae bacterium]|nr:hypothetical protein [Hyphomonadaceae bacterium]